VIIHMLDKGNASSLTWISGWCVNGFPLLMGTPEMGCFKTI